MKIFKLCKEYKRIFNYYIKRYKAKKYLRDKKGFPDSNVRNKIENLALRIIAEVTAWVTNRANTLFVAN